MRKDLEDLWFYYLIEIPMKRSCKENATIKEWSEKEDYFRSKLNEEQIKILEEYMPYLKLAEYPKKMHF